MYTSLLVPLDGSPQSEQAVPIAVALARRSAAVVELVHVHPALALLSGAPVLDPRLDLDARREMRDRLDGVAERLRSSAGVHVTATVLDGATVPALVGYVEERHPDLVVMTSHGRGGVSRLWLGSVAEALARVASAPVLVVRSDAARMPGSNEPVFRHVIVPLDGSPLAESVLDQVVGIATPGATAFTLVRIIVPAPPVTSELGVISLPDEDMARLKHEAGEYLEEVAADLRGLGAALTTRVVVDASPAQAILAIAEEGEADLLALATHGRAGLARAILGSVADKLLRGARSAVMLYHPPAALDRPLQESVAGEGDRAGAATRWSTSH